MDDDVGGALTIDHDNLLMTRNGFPCPARDPHFLSSDSGHILRLPRGRTEVYGTVPMCFGLRQELFHRHPYSPARPQAHAPETATTPLRVPT